MELLQFEVTNAGTLGSRWTPPAPETKKASSLPGAALAALLQEEDDEDDWGGDAPDMSAEFARLGHLNEESDTDALPLTADRRPNLERTSCKILALCHPLDGAGHL